MFDFFLTNPFYLYFLPLAAIPVILHIISRREKKEIYFPTLRFIRAALANRFAFLKLRQYLLLLIRVLILILLLLFFAKPYSSVFKNGETGGKHYVFLFDTSYSMGFKYNGTALIDIFKTNAEKILKITDPAAKIAVISFSDRLEFSDRIFETDRTRLSIKIKALSLTSNKSDLSAGLRAVNALLSDEGINDAAVILFSDNAKHLFKSEDASLKSRLFVFYSPDDKPNTSITGLDAEYVPEDEKWQIRAGISHYSDLPITGWPISLETSISEKLADIVNMPEAGLHKKTLYLNSSAGNITGRVNVLRDQLEIDDVCYFSFSRIKDPKVLIIDGEPGTGGIAAESYFIRKALANAEVVDETEFQYRRLDDYDVVFLLNMREAHAAIDNYVKHGGSLIVFLGSHSETSSLFLPCDVGNLSDKADSIQFTDAGLSLFHELDISGFELSKIKVDKYYYLSLKQSASSLIDLSAGWPFAAFSQYGKGEVVLFAASPDFLWSNIASKPIFKPLLQRFLYINDKYRAKKRVTMYSVGDMLKRSEYSGAAIIGPDSRQFDFTGNKEYVPLSLPGIYKVIIPGKENEFFSVNIDPSSGESDLKVLSKDKFESLLPNAQIVFVPFDDWERFLKIKFQGSDTSSGILILLVMLFLIELYFARRNDNA